MKKYFVIILMLIMAALLIFSLDLEYGNPKNMDYANYYIVHGIYDTGAINLVTAIYLDYRAYDTLIETIVLFTAVIGVTFFLRKEK